LCLEFTVCVYAMYVSFSFSFLFLAASFDRPWPLLAACHCIIMTNNVFFFFFRGFNFLPVGVAVANVNAKVQGHALRLKYHTNLPSVRVLDKIKSNQIY